MDENVSRNIEATCTKLLIAFGRYRDWRDSEAVATVVSSDCVWVRDADSVQGRDSIVEVVRKMSAGVALRHVLTNIEIKVLDENNAEGVAYYTVYRHLAGPGDDHSLPRPVSPPFRVGDYVSRFVRTDDGWKLSYASAKRVFSD